MQSLPLESEHTRLGASFGDIAGWRVPLDYGDEVAEQRAVRTVAGLIDWSAEGKTRVEGEDRTSFLDGVLTNDVGALKQGDGIHAAALDHKGRVHGDVVVYHGGDHYFLTTEPEATNAFLAHVNRLLVSDDASLTDVTGRWCALGLFGPRSGEILSKILGTATPGENYRVRATERDGMPVLYTRNPYFGGDGFEMWMPPQAAKKIWVALLGARAVPFGLRAAEALRIEAGRPKYPSDMNEDTLALEARLEPSISFTKGCYVGQEIVSRVVNQGHVNRLLVGFEVEGAEPPPAGTSVRVEGQDVGTVTTAARSAWRGKVLALGYVRRQNAEAGTEVVVGGFPGRVAALPFYRA